MPEYEVIVIGTGQAGLAAGHPLRTTGVSFTLLEAGELARAPEAPVIRRRRSVGFQRLAPCPERLDAPPRDSPSPEGRTGVSTGASDCATRERGCTSFTAVASGGVETVNTYDPANSIVYLHMNPRSDLHTASVTRTQSINRLPAGYMNRSPRTCLTAQFSLAA